ncbi:Type 1 glutamine amidotransferase-like domain-containing protein [Halobacillus rhizosphaerae]|uniref:Type 1 glutamine amidotransferase-like domain-containing protein n=1 Tax=Halobacillus rhizosphaerae TaxID=3064889 RepID=UPI00398BB22E
MTTHLFLFGGSPPFTPQLADKFSSLIRNGEIAVLYIEREGSSEYLPKYTADIASASHKIYWLPLKENYTKQECERLRRCGAIIIGGGDTELYHKFIVQGPLNSLIVSMFRKGVPVAGFSAGALISPVHCVISSKDNDQNIQLFKEGLGLLENQVISAHYLKWEEEQSLKEAVKQSRVPLGYGIADESGLYFHNHKLERTEGYIHIEYSS